MKYCSFVKHVDQKPLKKFEEDLQEKKGIPDAFKIDEIGVDSYFFFTIFWTFSQNPTE